jgi:hypothetical protein
MDTLFSKRTSFRISEGQKVRISEYQKVRIAQGFQVPGSMPAAFQGCAVQQLFKGSKALLAVQQLFRIVQWFKEVTRKGNPEGSMSITSGATGGIPITKILRR